MKKPRIDHDGLHKRLLTAFFEQFLAGFFPEIHQELDFTDFGPENFLTQEQFAEMDGTLHKLDVVAKVKTKGGAETCLIVFVEAQHSRRREFMARVFRYFATLHIRFKTVVIPIVLYTDPKKWTLSEDWMSYRISFAGHEFLNFKFLAIKTRTLSVKDYLQSHNPAQIALASQMDLGDSDLTRIKLSLLRQLRKSQMTEVEMLLAATFLDQYLDEVTEDQIQQELLLTEQPEFKEGRMLLDYVRNQGIEQGKSIGIEQR